jgi:hypothetical protein
VQQALGLTNDVTDDECCVDQRIHFFTDFLEQPTFEIDRGVFEQIPGAANRVGSRDRQGGEQPDADVLPSPPSDSEGYVGLVAVRCELNASASSELHAAQNSHFARMFRKFVGTSPSHFQNGK